MTDAAPALKTLITGTAAPAFLYLHGWGQRGGSLQGLAQLVSPGHKTILLDLPGFGESPNPPEDWSTRDYAERVLQVLEEAGVEDVVVLGHSFGGRVAIHLANMQPKRVRAVVLMASAGLRAKRGFRSQLRMRKVALLRALIRLLPPPLHAKALARHRQAYGSRDYRKAQETGIVGTFIKTVKEDLSELAGRIQQPVLLLWGEHDQETPVDMARRFHELIENSELVVLERKDHFPYLPLPDRAAFQIKTFLEAHEIVHYER